MIRSVVVVVALMGLARVDASADPMLREVPDVPVVEQNLASGNLLLLPPLNPLPAPPPHDIRKNRYISFTPNNPMPVAFMVTQTAPSAAFVGWVGSPDALGTSLIEPAAHFRTWLEPVIHVGDCGIIPVADYTITAFDGIAFSASLPVSTILLPSLNGKFWADVTGFFSGGAWTPPNGLTNAQDVLAIQAYISNSAFSPHLTRVDLGPETPDRSVNYFDVQLFQSALSAGMYPYAPLCTGQLGACITSASACTMESGRNCYLLSGSYLGDGVMCSEIGACCNSAAGTCIPATSSGCSAGSSNFLGIGSLCGGSIEACCLPSGACEEMDTACCLDSGGTPEGSGSTCQGDSNGNLIDDLCELTAPGLPASPDDIPKNRYITFVPSNGTLAVAYEITSPTCPGMVRWAGVPNASNRATAEAAPVFRASTEPVIHVGDAEVNPGARYFVRATHDGVTFSAPIEIRTTRIWGDITGTLSGGLWGPPDGCVTTNDIHAVLDFINGEANIDFVRVNVGSAAAMDPNLDGFVNVSDMLRVVAAFSGMAYPYPVTCACGPGTCDDLEFCNGGEACSAAICVPTSPACASGQVCDEGSDTCGPCSAHAECDDGVYCNGVEQCVLGACTSTGYPCAGMGCDEISDSCDPTLNGPPTLSLLPVYATGAHTIMGNVIQLGGGGQQVTLEFSIANWDPDMDLDRLLNSVQLTIDSEGYASGSGDPLSPVGFPATPQDGAFIAVELCSVSRRSCEVGQPACTVSEGTCVPSNPIFETTGGTSYRVRTSTLDYAYSLFTSGCEIDTGSPRYAGTLILNVPVTASGTYTIDLKPDLCSSEVNDCINGNVPGLREVPLESTLLLQGVLISLGCGCDGDVNNDGPTNASDVAHALQCAQGALPPASCVLSDVDCDGDVDLCDVDRVTCLVGGGLDCCGTDVICGACCNEDLDLRTCTSATAASCATLASNDYKGDNTDCGNYACGCDINNNSIPDAVESVCAVCRAIPPAGLDVLPTGGAFKIIYLDNSVQTLLGLTDAATAFARSSPFNHGGALESGAPVTNGGATPYPDTAALAPEPCVVPPGFPDDPSLGPEVHIEILSLDLSNGSERVRAGQALFDSLALAGRTDLYENTFGEAQGECIELPGKIYFNAFFEIETAGLKLYNKNAVVLRGEVNDLPIDLDDPGEDFINDPSFPAVALFDEDGVHQAYLVSVAFGSGGGGTLPPSSCESQRAFDAPISFTVDGSSNGVLISNPNHVNVDAAFPEKKVTVYRSSGVDPNLPPDTSNARHDTPAANLRGVVGASGFNANDAINALSYGKDGTVNLAVPNQMPVLIFSVDRTSSGVSCSDVRREFDGPPAEVGADVFVAPADPDPNSSSPVPGFGAYSGTFVPPCSSGRGSCLVTDQSTLGLQPLFGGIGHDNITSLETSRFLIIDRAYLTFTGPSFVGNTATIYTHTGDPAFVPNNLAVFATAGNMGLQAGDVIDALAISDILPGSVPQQPNGILNVSQDEVLFSLAPGSPSLSAAACGVLGGCSPADIFYSSFNGSFVRRYSAAVMGLQASDNLDALDISPGIGTADCNANGILDQCDIDRGESADGNGNTIPDECETKNRYVTFSPNIVYDGNAALTPVAFRVELVNNFFTPGATGVVGWVGAPSYQCDGGARNNLPCSVPVDCPGGTCTIVTARIQPTPVLRLWPEGVVHVGDCEVFPVSQYRISATEFPPSGPFVSPAFDVGTIRKPLGKSWGDVVGGATLAGWTPPNGITNVSDVQSVLFRIQSTPKPLFAAANLEAISSTDPCLNPFVNTADVLIVVKAANGEPYPFSTDPFTNICPVCP